jgi:ribosomal protein L14
VNATSAQTVVNNLTAGVYEFELLVTDDLGAIGRDTVMVTVLPAPNLLPVVFAGMDVTITLPINAVPLNGIVADPDGTIASVLWTKISGPSAGNFANSSQVNTTASGLVQGIYEFELSAADNDGAMVRDTMRVTVLPKPNVPPVANAGSDITITLPINYAVLMGSGVDSDGSIVNYEWIKIAGPQNYQIMTPGNPATLVVNMEQGVYQYQLKVIDNSGALAYDTVTVTVIPANLPPVSNAGTDIFLSLPADTATLRGSGTDVDGQVVAYSWRKIAGPDTYRILNTTQAVAKLRDLEAGVYQFELKVTDNNGAIDRDTVIVTVTFDTRRFSTTALYPNPATDILYLTINAQTMKNWTVVQIVDASGRVVQEEQFQRNAPTMVRKIDISSLKAGHYILQFNPEINTHSAIKFIKL